MKFRGMEEGGIDRRAVLITLAAAALGAAGPAAAETGVTDTRIKVGQSAVFTGPAQDFGVDYKAGIALAFDKVNKTGGVNGRTLELVSHDDAYEPKKTAENTAKLIDEDKVFALIGYVATGNLIAAMPLAEKAGVPMFAPLVGTTSFRTTHNRYLFHVRASYETELRKIVGHLATLGINNIAVIYQNSAFGKSNLDTCLQIAQGLKVKVVDSVPMEIAATDAKPQVAQLTKAQPGAVVMIMAGKMVEVFLRDYRAAGAASPLYTISVGITDAPGSAQRLNGGIEGLVTASIVPSPQASRLAIVADYRKDRADAGEKIDSYTMLEGYIAARVFVEGLKRAGKALTREGFIKAMEDMGTTKIGDFPLVYGPNNHNGSNFVDLEMYTRSGSLRR
ncbi:ABC transporter substrate-binding protein [Acidovorax sp. LjRoot74]|uniref:ABC transporter substrate-binding protein n=1 Tax=Acidovorax sp. LjRoot74 TaxID=3342337 RepID=UPI003ECD058D